MRAHHYALAAVVLFVVAVLAFVLLSGGPEADPPVTRVTPAAGPDPAGRELIPRPDDVAPAERPAASDPDPRAVAEGEGTRVAGTVRDPSGYSVAGVRIIPPGASGEAVPNYYSESDGTFAFRLAPLPGRRDYEVRFLADGYEPYVLRLSERDLAEDDIRRDVELAVIGERAEVGGTVSNPRGEGVEGITVQLYSTTLGERYTAETDRFGAFSLPSVKPGTDYQVLIQPGDEYQDYSERRIVVPGEGLTLDLVLEPLGAGRLSGRLVDPEGNPIPDMSFTVRSDQSVRSPLRGTSDASGYFSLENVPSGRLTFSADPEPGLKVRGVGLGPGERREVVVVLDWGRHALSGRVVDDRGNPVPGAQVAASWMLQDGTIRSSSTRTAATGPDGSFRFDQMGPGPYRVDVTASGFQPTGGEYKTGSDLELRLPRQDG